MKECLLKGKPFMVDLMLNLLKSPALVCKFKNPVGPSQRRLLYSAD